MTAGEICNSNEKRIIHFLIVVINVLEKKAPALGGIGGCSLTANATFAKTPDFVWHFCLKCFMTWRLDINK